MKAMNQPAACDEFAKNIKIAFDSMTKDSDQQQVIGRIGGTRTQAYTSSKT